MGFLRIDAMNMRTKFEIIGRIRKIWAVPGYAHAHFSKIFNGLMDPVNVPAKFEVRSFTLS